MEYIVYAEGKILAIVEAERVTVTSGGMTFMGADSAAVAEFSTAGIQGWVKGDAYRAKLHEDPEQPPDIFTAR